MQQSLIQHYAYAARLAQIQPLSSVAVLSPGLSSGIQLVPPLSKSQLAGTDSSLLDSTICRSHVRRAAVPQLQQRQGGTQYSAATS